MALFLLNGRVWLAGRTFPLLFIPSCTCVHSFKVCLSASALCLALSLMIYLPSLCKTVSIRSLSLLSAATCKTQSVGSLQLVWGGYLIRVRGAPPSIRSIAQNVGDTCHRTLVRRELIPYRRRYRSLTLLHRDLLHRRDGVRKAQ